MNTGKFAHRSSWQRCCRVAIRQDIVLPALVELPVTIIIVQVGNQRLYIGCIWQVCCPDSGWQLQSSVVCVATSSTTLGPGNLTGVAIRESCVAFTVFIVWPEMLSRFRLATRVVREVCSGNQLHSVFPRSCPGVAIEKPIYKIYIIWMEVLSRLQAGNWCFLRGWQLNPVLWALTVVKVCGN